jgi:hypothetical protein
MSEQQSKPGVLAWAALFLVFFVLYLWSESQMGWLIARGLAPEWMHVLFAPLWWIRKFTASHGL